MQKKNTDKKNSEKCTEEFNSLIPMEEKCEETNKLIAR